MGMAATVSLQVEQDIILLTPKEMRERVRDKFSNPEERPVIIIDEANGSDEAKLNCLYLVIVF